MRNCFTLLKSSSDRGRLCYKSTAASLQYWAVRVPWKKCNECHFQFRDEESDFDLSILALALCLAPLYGILKNKLSETIRGKGGGGGVGEKVGGEEWVEGNVRLPLKLGIKSGQKQVPGKKINSPRWGKENSISERRPIQHTGHW